MKKNSLASNTILLSIGTLINKGLLFVMVPFFSRWLSAEDYGTFDLLCTYVSLLIPILDLASGEAVFRFTIETESKELKKKYISSGFIIVAINSLAYLFIVIILYNYFGFKRALPFTILLLGQLINEYLRAFLRSIKRLDIYSISSAISVVFISISVSILVLKFKMELNGILVGYGLGYIMSNLIIILWGNYFEYFSIKSISINSIKELITYSYPLIPNNISWWVMNVSDRILLNIFIGPVANGIYAIANKVPGICSSVFSMFGISWQQSAVENVNSDDRSRYFNQVYNKTISVIISLCAGILSLNFMIFNFIFDSKYFEGHLYAPILVTAIIFGTLSQFYGAIQISFKQPKENGITNIIGAIVNIVINLLLIRLVGIYAAVISTLASYLVVCLLRKERLKKKIKLKIDKKNYIYMLSYLYFFVTSYMLGNITFNIINLILATLLFTTINKEFILSILNKILRRKSEAVI